MYSIVELLLQPHTMKLGLIGPNWEKKSSIITKGYLTMYPCVLQELVCCPIKTAGFESAAEWKRNFPSLCALWDANLARSRCMWCRRGTACMAEANFVPSMVVAPMLTKNNVTFTKFALICTVPLLTTCWTRFYQSKVWKHLLMLYYYFFPHFRLW